MRLRPYKSCDAKTIIQWVQDKDAFHNWGGERFGSFPVRADTLNGKYYIDNGDCAEEDNFYPWTATDNDNHPIGHFIMRYTGGNSRRIRFGWVVVDPSLRGKGYGKQMITLGLKYAFEMLKAERVTIGVFEHNDSAHRCYLKAGFTDTGIAESEFGNVIEMEILRSDCSADP